MLLSLYALQNINTTFRFIKKRRYFRIPLIWFLLCFSFSLSTGSWTLAAQKSYLAYLPPREQRNPVTNFPQNNSCHSDLHSASSHTDSKCNTSNSSVTFLQLWLMNTTHIHASDIRKTLTHQKIFHKIFE